MGMDGWEWMGNGWGWLGIGLDGRSAGWASGLAGVEGAWRGGRRCCGAQATAHACLHMMKNKQKLDPVVGKVKVGARHLWLGMWYVFVFVW